MKFMLKAALAALLCALAALSSFAELQQIQDVHRMSNKGPRLFSLSSFHWSDCGVPADPGHLKALTLTPDPLKLPGNISVSFEANLGVNLLSPIELDVHVQKHVVVWVTVPCIKQVGSCNYPDVCPILEAFGCPAAFKEHGIPCKCPIANGTYSLPASQFFVDDSFLPSILTDGQYRVTAKLFQTKKSIGCGYFEFSITR